MGFNGAYRVELGVYGDGWLATIGDVDGIAVTAVGSPEAGWTVQATVVQRVLTLAGAWGPAPELTDGAIVELNQAVRTAGG